jgi:hypothetical protein
MSRHRKLQGICLGIVIGLFGIALSAYSPALAASPPAPAASLESKPATPPIDRTAPAASAPATAILVYRNARLSVMEPGGSSPGYTLVPLDEWIASHPGPAATKWLVAHSASLDEWLKSHPAPAASSPAYSSPAYSPPAYSPPIYGPSGSDVYVHGYVKRDGTYVQPHMRSAPDGNFWNNWSTKGNVNPYTGKEGTRVTPPRIRR